MKTRHWIHSLMVILCFLLIFSCSKKESNEIQKMPEPMLNLPSKSTAILPANGESCSNFTEAFGEPDKAIIALSWTSAEKATSYIIKIVESETEVLSETYSANEAEVLLDKGKSYAWTITSKNLDGETLSDTFSFTTPGVPFGNFVPYAAAITAAYYNTNSTLSVSWTGSDKDNDSLSYDIRVINSEEIEIVNISNLFAGPVTVYVDYGETYTIRVISRDTHGNYSISTITKEIND